jgi:hypothetical protein
MKRIVISVVAFVGLLFAIMLMSNPPLRGQSDDQKLQSEIQIGYAIAPVPLNLQGKNRALVGLGSYIVNAQGDCNSCHTCPSYDPSPYQGHPAGHNPFYPNSGDGKINSVNYLAGGVNFGPAVSRDLTPDANGKPEGLTLEQFESALRTGIDPISGDHLIIMPWPTYRFMSDRDLEAIYTYLTAIPRAVPGDCSGAGQ